MSPISDNLSIQYPTVLQPRPRELFIDGVMMLWLGELTYVLRRCTESNEST